MAISVALDATSNGANSSGQTTLTVAHTCTGTNLVLLVGVNNFGGSAVTGVTYNSVAMSKIGESTYNPTDTGSTDTMSLWGLIAPATGAHNIVATRSDTNSNMTLVAASYSGANQSTLPDASTTNVKTSGGATTIVTSLSSVANNSWHVSVIGTTGGAPSASTGVTSRATQTQTAFGDSNGPKTPAGSYSMTWGISGAAFAGVVMASIAPPSVGPTTVKTRDGIAFASVKTIDGIAVASLKTIDGLS